MRHGLPHPDPLARGQKLREGDLARSHFGDDRFRRRLRRVGDGRRERASRATQLSGRHERVRGCVRHARERPFVNIRIAHGVEALVGSGGVDARTEALCGPLVARRLCRVRLRLVGVVEELRGVELLGGDGLSRTVGSHVRDGQHMRAGDWSSGAYLGGDPRLVHLASNVRRVEAAHFAAGGRSDGRRTAATCNEPEGQPGARPLHNSTRKGPALYISTPHAQLHQPHHTPWYPLRALAPTFSYLRPATPRGTHRIRSIQSIGDSVSAPAAVLSSASPVRTRAQRCFMQPYINIDPLLGPSAPRYATTGEAARLLCLRESAAGTVPH